MGMDDDVQRRILCCDDDDGGRPRHRPAAVVVVVVVSSMVVPESRPRGDCGGSSRSDETRAMLLPVADLEESLEACCCSCRVEDTEPPQDAAAAVAAVGWDLPRPSVWYYPVPDAAWLACRRLGGSGGKTSQLGNQPTNHRPIRVSSSITGLVEDFSCSIVHIVSAWKVAAKDNDIDVAVGYYNNSCSCYSSNRSLGRTADWTRRPLTYTPPPTVSRIPDPAAKAVWVDLRNIDTNALFPTTMPVVHFLRSLLGTSHVASPWVPEEKISSSSSSSCTSTSTIATSDTDCVMLLWSGRAPHKLTSFRVSDICPSWCLYSSALLDLSANQPYPWTVPTNDDDDDDADNESAKPCCCELLVYRRLLSRERLSALHPVTQQPVPVTGCLWETVVTFPTDALLATGTTVTQAAPEPVISYRLTAPPYIDYAAEYQDILHCQVQKLLEPEALHILQAEVASIPQWTAWPEQQHYRAASSLAAAEDEDETNGSGLAPWNVFPLCHCFPANDVTQRQWIAVTAAHVPGTVQLLQTLVGDTLRTALYSRLDPDSVLEAHTGWADLANHVYRVHVPVDIPSGHACGTWVDGCVTLHSSGELLVFDDSKTHRAFNYSLHSRVVLILDLERPAHLPPGTATGGHSEELDSFIAQFAAPK